jgi:hypothetical protein
MLGSFSPRECGIATFTKDVLESLVTRGGATCEVVAVDEPAGESRTYCPAVAARLAREDRASYSAIASFIGADPASVLLVQHEDGPGRRRTGSRSSVSSPAFFACRS